MEEEITTLRLKKGTLKELENLKIHKRQSNEEVLCKLIQDAQKRDGENTQQT